MMSYTIKEFSGSDADYTVCLDLYNKAWPEYYRSEKVFRFGDSSINPKHFFKRLIVEKDQNPIGHIDYMEEWESEEEGDYFSMLSIDPAADFAPAADSLLAHVFKELRSRNGTRLNIVFLEDRLNVKRFLEDNHFTFAQREPRSELHIQTFDFDQFATLEEKLTAEGIEIASLLDLQARFPDWQRRVYDLEWPIVQDVPTPFPIKRQPFEEFIKLFDHPNYMPESDFYAVGGEQWVGLANVLRVDGDPTYMEVGLTGVLPSHRQRGIATALKVKTIKFAQRYGAKIIRTNNEENNPMYDLNIKLGFKPKPALLTYQITLGDSHKISATSEGKSEHSSEMF